MHLIWISIVLPGMVCIVWAIPESRLPWIWGMTFALALLGLVGVIGFDLFTFLSAEGSPTEVGMRMIFALLMATDLPLVAMALGSSINWLVSRKYASGAWK